MFGNGFTSTSRYIVICPEGCRGLSCVLFPRSGCAGICPRASEKRQRRHRCRHRSFRSAHGRDRRRRAALQLARLHRAPRLHFLRRCNLSQADLPQLGTAMASTSMRKSGPQSRDTSTNVTAGAAAGVTVAKNRSRASRYADKSSMLRTKTVSLIKFAAVQPTDRSATVRFSNTESPPPANSPAARRVRAG